MAHPPIGIDLGTSTSIISAFIDGKPVPIKDPYSNSPIVPSIVGISRNGELLVGEMAKRRGVELVEEFKRTIGLGGSYTLGGVSYSAEEMAATVLRHLKENAERFLATEIRDVVISVPANYEDTRRRATVAAAQIAGLNVIRLINEPTAGAIAYGMERSNATDTLLVYDFGGGTLDVSIVELLGGVLDVKTSYGVPKLGGKDFDEALAVWAKGVFLDQNPGAVVADRTDGEVGRNLERNLKSQCEEVKKLLSSVSIATLDLPNFGFRAGSEMDLQVDITREQFEEIVAPLVRASLEAVNAALQKAGISMDAITKVLLVGGTTHIPCVQRAVEEHTRHTRVGGCEPDLAVANGAAIVAARAANAPGSEHLTVQDVCTYGLGILTVQHVNGRYMLAYDGLIEPNTPVPFTVTRDHYRLLRPDQETMELEVVQDLNGNAVYAEDTVPTGASGTIENIPPAPNDEPHQVRVDFTYDVNGIVTLKASIPATGQELTIHTRPYQGVLSPEQALLATTSLNMLWNTRPLAHLYRNLIETAEARVRTSTGPSDLAQWVADLKTKISMNDRDGAAQAADQIRRLIGDAPE
jgi:molecular chaperone DnaK